MLPGNAFAGFFDAGLRSEYLDIGYNRGLEVLGGLGWSHRPEHRSDRPARRDDGRSVPAAHADHDRGPDRQRDP